MFRKTAFCTAGIIAISLFFTGQSQGAGTLRISVTDFAVQSGNPSYRYLGKGFAEFVGIELAGKQGIRLVEREKRNELMKEQEISMTGLVDEKAQVKLGKMLAANYIVVGNIFDIAGQLTVTFKVISTETGEIVTQNKVTGNIKNYDFLSASISEKIFTGLKLKIPSSVARKIEKNEEKREEAVISFSKGVDAYDKNDTRTAKKELEKAKSYDPGSAAVLTYLAKLSTTSPKFKVEMEVFMPSGNPALLGFLRQDRFYYIGSMDLTAMKTDQTLTSVGDGYKVDEGTSANRLGYAFPLGEGLGMVAEFFFANIDTKLESLVKSEDFSYGPSSIGGLLGAGFRPAPWLSLGASFSLFRSKVTNYVAIDPPEERMDYAGDIGFALSFLDGNLVFDTHAGFSSQVDVYLDKNGTVQTDGKLPVIVENTLTSAFLDRKLFVVLKGIMDIYTDNREGRTLRGIPVLEYWLFSFLSLRGGYEYTHIDISEKKSSGSGFVAGLTVRIGEFDLDVNYSKRKRPVRVLPGYSMDNEVLLIGLTKNATFFE